MIELDADGPAAPPRANGELVFAAPWERRLFGVTMALHERGVFAWPEFRELLVEEIARRDENAYEYYAYWARALDVLLAARGLVDPAALAARIAELAARPAGHDHDHDHA
jgi:nitrile hydratase accessory protein